MTIKDFSDFGDLIVPTSVNKMVTPLLAGVVHEKISKETEQT